ncbi:MAG: phytoene desaturase family protein [Bacteroidales bacterium]
MEALIIGTGLGGLTTALRLAKRGYKVTMVEKFRQPGGRLNQLSKDGFTFDMAPSFFSMSYEFKEFVEDCGIGMPFTFHELDPLYAVNFTKGNRTYIIHKDLDKLAAEFADVEPGFRNKIDRYLASAGRLFHDTEGKVIRRNFSSVAQFLATLATVPVRHLPKMFRSFMDELDRYFDSDEVKQILSLTAFFLGATPYDTPAIYTLLSYTELKHDGYYNVKGGMYKIVEGLIGELEKAGVEIHYNTEIVGIRGEEGTIKACQNGIIKACQNGIIKACLDDTGKEWHADLVVVNADAAAFRGQVLGRKRYRPERLDRMKWTLAPLTIYLGVDAKVPGIHHHHYFLGDNFKEYAGAVFKNQISLERPYYYVNTISKFNPESAPEGCESLFILCPVPDLRYKPDWSDAEHIADSIIEDLSTRIGFDLQQHTRTRTVLTPLDWEKTFNLYRGSGLSLAHDLNQIGAFRPPNVDEHFDNLFYVGSSTVPGTGLPMAVISSKLVTERIVKRYGPVPA